MRERVISRTQKAVCNKIEHRSNFAAETDAYWRCITLRISVARESWCRKSLAYSQQQSSARPCVRESELRPVSSPQTLVPSVGVPQGVLHPPTALCLQTPFPSSLSLRLSAPDCPLTSGWGCLDHIHPSHCQSMVWLVKTPTWPMTLPGDRLSTFPPQLPDLAPRSSSPHAQQS